LILISNSFIKERVAMRENKVIVTSIEDFAQKLQCLKDKVTEFKQNPNGLFYNELEKRHQRTSKCKHFLLEKTRSLF